MRGSAGKQREGRKKQKEKRRKEKEASLPSPCMQIERILEHRCHMTRTGGGGLHSVDTEGLCQLSDDVMIYFEEVMSGFCSEAAVGDARTHRPYGRVARLKSDESGFDLVFLQ